jgi:anti-sigma regulatory factor (Ser/Thr protein kinase)
VIAGLARALGLDPAAPDADRRLVVTPADPFEDADATPGHPGTFLIEAGLDPVWLGPVLARAHRTGALCGVCLSAATVLGGPAIERFLEPVWERAGIGADRVGDIGLALTEIVANAVLHGNLRDTKPAEAAPALLRRGLAVLAFFDGAELALCVIQEGPGAPARAPGPSDRPAPELPDPAVAGGRGLFIVQALADRLVFDEDGRGCTVGFRTTP